RRGKRAAGSVVQEFREAPGENCFPLRGDPPDNPPRRGDVKDQAGILAQREGRLLDVAALSPGFDGSGTGRPVLAPRPLPNLPAQRWMKRLRRDRLIAPGQTLPEARSGISESRVSWPSLSTIACLKFRCSGDSSVARKRVPSSTPSAPSARAAARPRPSAMPP